ncbi:MAG: DUF3570 domain-containing protein [Gammaproteobacteria bacterium]|nr:DUF3570 domain-containing protein [Gammaproteobacteria bacterium]MDH4253214.1 DUF3570 domain-containing protein [Gammaproteobacteria bacterium]MDH5309007.1 DUF3570 domain-containing protein [Gammaproteobacteria bacterium]
MITNVKRIGLGVAALLLALAQQSLAGVLPDDRADLLYHLYDGGGVEIDGPSLLVRKKVGKSVSVVGNYYVDMVSSASIDVITTASPYTEERKQWSLGMDYLRGNTTMSANFTNSEESDFDATTYSFSVSQDMFGDLTTLTLSYALGDDTVGRSDNPDFSRDNTRQHYGIGLTQILTRNLIASLNFETITDEGFLNNPYRSVRYLDSANPIGYSFEPELYPATRTSNAVGLRARYYLPYRAAIQGEYRYFADTWDITSHTAAITYVHPMGDWTFEAKYRWHDQTGAHFFRDLFQRSEQTNFRGRDKELSPMTSHTFKLAASYEFLRDGWNFIDRGSVNFSVDFLQVDYDEFRDISGDAVVGTEPLYALDATVYQLFFSFWY